MINAKEKCNLLNNKYDKLGIVNQSKNQSASLGSKIPTPSLGTVVNMI